EAANGAITSAESPILDVNGNPLEAATGEEQPRRRRRRGGRNRNRRDRENVESTENVENEGGENAVTVLQETTLLDEAAEAPATKPHVDARAMAAAVVNETIVEPAPVAAPTSVEAVAAAPQQQQPEAVVAVMAEAAVDTIAATVTAEPET